MYSILMTTLFSKALILEGEISGWSLLGLKGLSSYFLFFLQDDLNVDDDDLLNDDDDDLLDDWHDMKFEGF